MNDERPAGIGRLPADTVRRVLGRPLILSP
jgi:hypothetical protein